MKVELDKESQKLLENLVKQIDRFNGNLEDFKKMIAPWLGFRVKKGEDKK